jgi:hypothetical protein
MYVHAVKTHKFVNIINNMNIVSQFTNLGGNKSEIIIDTTGKTHILFVTVSSLIQNSALCEDI